MTLTILNRLMLHEPFLIIYNQPIAVLREDSSGNHNHVYIEGIRTTRRLRTAENVLIRKELNDTAIRNKIIYI